MITVVGRKLIIPETDEQIGTTYDNNSEVRHIRVNRITAGGVDLSNLRFKLDLEYADNTPDTCLLDVEVQDKYILLIWTIPAACLTHKGTVWIAIRAYDENGTVKWATNRGAVYVGHTIFDGEEYNGHLAEFEQLEERITQKTEILDANEVERQAAEDLRKANEERRVNNEAEWQRQAETAIETANETLRGAQEQAGIATQKATESTRKAEEAAASAISASGSAGTASQAAVTATTKAEDAEASATAANGSYEAASRAAGIATTRSEKAAASAISANESAEMASQAATTATTKAGEAAASATAANGSAGTARQAATTATAKAKEAGESSENAKRYAEQAKEVVGFDGTAATVSAIDTHGAAVRSASGIGHVTIDDAGDDPLLNINIAGKSDQFTTTGAQLFDASKLVRTHNEVKFTVEENGGILVTGNTLQNAANSAVVTVTLSPGTYYMGGSTPIGNSQIFVRIKLWHGDSSTVISDASFSVDGTETKIECFIQLYQGLSDFKAVVYPMLNAGSTPKPWEPYTGGKPSPSPEYPQPIISTGTVTMGEQLLDTEAYELGTFGNATGNPNNSEITYRWLQYIPVTEGSTIYFKKPLCICYYDSDKRFVSCDESPDTYQRLVPQTAAFIRCRTFAGDFADFNHRDYMISNNPISAWEPYTGGKPSPSEEYPQPLEVTVTGANLFDASLLKSMAGGTWSLSDGERKISVTGINPYAACTAAVPIDSIRGKTVMLSGSIESRTNVDCPVAIQGRLTLSDGRLEYYAATYKKMAITIPEDAQSFKIELIANNRDTALDIANTTVFTDVLLSFDAEATWELFAGYQTATIQLTAPLYGIGDVRDRIMCKDGIWGMERQFVPLIFDGSEDEKWEISDTNDTGKKRYITAGYNNVIKAETEEATTKILCDVLKAGTNLDTWRKTECISSSPKSQVYIYLEKLSSGDLAAFKAYLASHPISAIFERTTPTWEPLPAATQSALNALTTFTGTTHINITAGGPEPDVAVEYFGQPGDKVTVQDMCDSFAAPGFDDSGVVQGISGFSDFLNRMTSRMRLSSFFRDLKAGLKFVLHTGQLVNNGLCNEPGKYPLDAAYGRTLLEMIGNTANLPGGAADIVSAIVTQNSNLDDRTAVADILAIANAGPSGRRIVNCGGNTLNTPYKAGLTTLQSGTAVVCMSSANYGTILYVAAGTDAVFLRPKVDGTWKDWERLLTNADYNVQSITNQYGLNLHLVKFGNDNLKVIRLSGYINKTLTAGTEYIIASNVSLKSRVDWYHNVFVSGKGSELTVYLNIDNDGNVKITPKTAIASGIPINMMEYYV